MKKKVYREIYRTSATIEEFAYELEKQKMEAEVHKLKQKIEETKPKKLFKRANKKVDK